MHVDTGALRVNQSQSRGMGTRLAPRFEYSILLPDGLLNVPTHPLVFYNPELRSIKTVWLPQKKEAGHPFLPLTQLKLKQVHAYE